MMNRAVFIDRDGVVVKAIIRKGFPRPTAPFTRNEFEMFHRSEEALELIGSMGFLRLMTTNQPDVAYGYTTFAEWAWMHRHVEMLPFEWIYCCLHKRDDGCECKKPKPGMLQKAARDFNLDLSRCYMVGDTISDIGAARAVGATPILVRHHYNLELQNELEAADFYEAAKLILKRERGEVS